MDGHDEHEDDPATKKGRLKPAPTDVRLKPAPDVRLKPTLHART